MIIWIILAIVTLITGLIVIALSGDSEEEEPVIPPIPNQPTAPNATALPVITSFQVAPSVSDIILTPIFSGGAATISWTDSLGGGGPIVATDGQPITRSLARNTTYRLTVTNAAGSTTKTVGAYIIPSIVSFTASPAGAITRGNSVTITPIFDGHNATITTVSGGTQSSRSVLSGVAEIYTPTVTSTYTLRVTNIWNNVPTTQDLTVQVV